MALFCAKHSNSQAPISVISEIISDKDSIKYEDLCANFEALGISKVKDLANSTLTKVSKIPLAPGVDTLAVLYSALEVYDQQRNNQLINARQEFENKNIAYSQDTCFGLLINNPQDINILILLSSIYFHSNEYEKSMEILLKIHQIYPNSADVFRNLGSIYWKKCEYEKATVAYFRAVENTYNYYDCWNLYAKALVLSDPENTEFYYKYVLQYKSDLYMVRYDYANYLFSLNQVKEAEHQYQIVRKDAPEFPLTLNSLGCMYFKNDKENAISYFNQAVDLDPKSTVVWINLGITYIGLKKYDIAIEVFKKAFQLDPNNTVISKYLARIYLKQENIVSTINTYKRYLLIAPDNIDVNYELGVVYLNCLKNYTEAIKYFEKCMKLNLKTKDFYINLTKTYMYLNKLKCASKTIVLLGDFYTAEQDKKNAKSAYTSAVIINPDNAEGHWKLGIKLYELGCFDQSAIRYKKSIELKPNFSDVYFDSAIIFEKQNQYEKALRYYNMTLKLQPDHFYAMFNQIVLNRKLGRTDDVIKLSNMFLLHEHSYKFEVHAELANLYYYEKNDLDLALLHYDEALNIDSSSTNLHIFKGKVLLDLKKPEEALDCFTTAVKLDPLCIIAHTNIGSFYKDQGNFKEAINYYELVLILDPDCPVTFCNLIQCYQQVCNWQDYDFHIGKLRDIILKQINDGQLPSILPHHSLLYPLSSEILKEIAIKNAEQCIQKSNIGRHLTKSFKYPISLTPDGCIRVGYVSSDFENHATSQLMQSIPYLHNRNKIEVFFYALSSNDNSKSWFKISESDHLRDISEMNVVEAANQINNDGIHILINMNGYIKGARNEIFALRPASIQVLWFGYPGTSGASFIDYLITDNVCSPPEFKHYYTEKLALMNRTVFIGDHKQLYGDLSMRICNKYQNKPTRGELKTTIVLNKGYPMIKKKNVNQSLPPTDTPSSMYSTKSLPNGTVKFYTRSEYSLPENAVVYCNFNKLYKIDPPTFKMWTTILKNVPNSVLWLLKFPEDGVENLLNTSLKLNVDPMRIIFGNVELKDDHMRRIQLADIFLDTSICSGKTTCLDALWAGLPIVTLPGETFASRIATSQLTTLGCTETIAQNEEQYVEIAVKLGENTKLLQNLRSTIWTLRTESKLFDCKSYTEELEIIYKDMWDNFRIENHLDL